VLDGSVQREGNRLRITTQLIDALTGKHLWADRYDRDLKDFFSIQDEITANILNELHVKLVFGENWRKAATPANLDYFKKMRKGWSHYRVFTPESNEQARRLYEEAITLEPEAAEAYNMLGWTYITRMRMGTSKSLGKDLERAFELAQKAIELTDDSIGEPHSLLGFLYLLKRQYNKAVEEAEKAVALSPNSSSSRRHLAAIYNYVGKREEAINLAKQAIRLNPFARPYYFEALGEAHLMAGQYEEAIEAFKKALHLNPKDSVSIMNLAIAYSLLGREEEARAMAEEFLTISPKFSAKRHEMLSFYENQADRAFIADAMRKAGFPE
jgi:adenylate cyclase